jgi:hypothetical protein
LRSKIEENPANPQLLRTVRGKGYVFCPPRGPATDAEQALITHLEDVTGCSDPSS